MSDTAADTYASAEARRRIRIFFCGDVMTGRGIDQILPHPCDPRLHEDYAQSAADYVWLAEILNGRVPENRTPAYIWGAALAEFDRAKPDARIINLETSITRSEEWEPKGINYRMSPENADCLTAAGIDCCVLANNHVLDWGRSGLLETLATLRGLHIGTAGAGRDLAEARAPWVLPVAGKGRVIVFAFASITSGTPRTWAATTQHAGVNLLSGSTEAMVALVAGAVDHMRRPGDLFIVSIHWGGNWGYEISEEQRRLAHALVDEADIAAVHGHSSHHAKAIEIYKERLVLYGCGDFLNDYEGIEGYEDFRGDLALMYFADFEPATGSLERLELVPLQIRRLSLAPASCADIEWIEQRLDRESAQFGTRVERTPADRLAVFRRDTGT